MKLLISKAQILLLVLVCFACNAEAAPKEKLRFPDLHRASNMVTGGCESCHAGSKMNRAVKETCLQCHGSIGDLKGAEKKKLLNPFYRGGRQIRKIDMRSLLEKEYRHPLGEEGNWHSAHEELPERVMDAPRHVECVDCHNAHYLKTANKLAGLRGVSKTGIYGVRARYEYEICFNCHSDSFNLPVWQTNKRLEFDENNPSYHPVVAEGQSGIVPSLKTPYKETYEEPGDISIIKCTDCHGNDDDRGPQGPHASIYPFILKKKYSMQDGLDERPKEYDLCYSCHKRSSILGNISFRWHSLHIQGDIIKGVKGTSCFTCHDAHGSREYTHLIKFNEEVVFINTSSLELKFVDKGEFTGECYLNCHGVNHSPKGY